MPRKPPDPPPSEEEPDWAGFAHAVEDSEHVQRLKVANQNLSRQLYEVKHKQADYLRAVYQAATDAISEQSIQPVRPPAKVRAGVGAPEVAVALLSDIQTGKITPTYNSEVAKARVDRYADKIIKLAQIQERDHPVRECVVPMLGDLVEGTNIFPGQEWLIDSTLYTQLLDTTPVIVVDFIRKLLTHFDTVRAVCVDGNHGRIGRKGQFGPMDNADRMVYRIIKLMLREEPRFTLEMTDPEGERNWFTIMQIGNYSALLFHGDQIKPTLGFPFYGLGKKVQGWGSGGLGKDVEFQDAMLGHWHQLARIPLNHRSVWINGSTESSNTFAAEYLSAQSLPMQWLLFVDPERGRVTATYGVELQGDDEPVLESRLPNLAG